MSGCSGIVSLPVNAGQSQVCRTTFVGAPLALKIDIVSFSAANLIGGFVFGSIGFVAFVYGKKMNLWKPMFLGIALMVYPYFINNDAIMIVIGLFGSTALFFVRE
jgi:hypothetical protein